MWRCRACEAQQAAMKAAQENGGAGSGAMWVVSEKHRNGHGH
jgi:hypothetical protein